MKYFAASLALALLSSTPAFAQNMSVSTFLAKADALKKKGPLALFSSGIGVLKKEMQAISVASKAESDARKAAGLRPLACPPEKSNMKAGELFGALRDIPPEQREKITLKKALEDIVAKRYPCPK